MSALDRTTGRATTRQRKNQTSADTGKSTTPSTPLERRIPLTDIETARRLRKYFESQIRPATLLRRLAQLRDEIAAQGPSEERSKKRIPLLWPLMIYRGQANYDRMKVKHGVVSEDFEYMYTRPLTETDRQHIKSAWALDKEIRDLLGIPRRKSRKRAS